MSGQSSAATARYDRVAIAANGGLMYDDMSLRDAHRLTEELEDRMRETLSNAQVMIHTGPYEEERQHHELTPH